MATFSLVCAHMICRCVNAVGAIFKIYILESSVATHLRCGGIFSIIFYCKFPTDCIYGRTFKIG